MAKQEKRISAAEAARAAAAYLQSLVPLAQDILVEESELSEDDKSWFITLSYNIGMAFGPKEYKVFKVNSSSGKVLSMKIRQK